jgi:hypothetical protein
MVANFDFSFGATSIFPSVVTSIFEVATEPKSTRSEKAKIKVLWVMTTLIFQFSIFHLQRRHTLSQKLPFLRLPAHSSDVSTDQ